jgi:ATP-binding cassette subfamily C protein LapB
MSMLELVDRVIVLDQGRVVADGPKAEVLAALQAPAEGATPANLRETPTVRRGLRGHAD